MGAPGAGNQARREEMSQSQSRRKGQMASNDATCDPLFFVLLSIDDYVYV